MSGVAVVQDFMQVLQKGELEEAFRGYFHDDALIREANSLPYPGDHKGPDGLLRIFSLIGAKFDLTVHGFQLFDAGASETGEMVVTKIDATFTRRTSGTPLRMEAVELYTVRDDKIVMLDVFYRDTKAFIELYES